MVKHPEETRRSASAQENRATTARGAFPFANLPEAFYFERASAGRVVVPSCEAGRERNWWPSCAVESEVGHENHLRLVQQSNRWERIGIQSRNLQKMFQEHVAASIRFYGIATHRPWSSETGKACGCSSCREGPPCRTRASLHFYGLIKGLLAKFGRTIPTEN